MCTRFFASLIFSVSVFSPTLHAADLNKGLACFSEKDYACAVAEWRPLAEQGDASAQNNLGYMYEQGQGVKQDYAEAIKWYRLAAEQGDALAQENLAKLTNILHCKDNASTQLFGQNVLCATRQEMRTALKSLGVKANREDDGYFADLYDSRHAFTESTELALHYINGDFAKAIYTFPSDQVKRIHSMVTLKYGAPIYSRHKLSSKGNVTYTWSLRDRIEIKVSRVSRGLWSNRTTYTYLTYTHPENNPRLDLRLAEIEAENWRKEDALRNSAF